MSSQLQFHYHLNVKHIIRFPKSRKNENICIFRLLFSAFTDQNHKTINQIQNGNINGSWGNVVYCDGIMDNFENQYQGNSSSINRKLDVIDVAYQDEWFCSITIEIIFEAFARNDFDWPYSSCLIFWMKKTLKMKLQRENAIFWLFLYFR